jgi:hypothetical protein
MSPIDLSQVLQQPSRASIGGIPEAAASGVMLTRAGFRSSAIFGLWSTVLLAGIVAAAAGKLFLGGSDSLLAIFLRASPAARCWRWWRTL